MSSFFFFFFFFLFFFLLSFCSSFILIRVCHPKIIYLEEEKRKCRKRHGLYVLIYDDMRLAMRQFNYKQNYQTRLLQRTTLICALHCTYNSTAGVYFEIRKPLALDCRHNVDWLHCEQRSRLPWRFKRSLLTYQHEVGRMLKSLRPLCCGGFTIYFAPLAGVRPIF